MKDLEAQGLPLAEEACELVVDKVFAWVEGGLMKMGGMYAIIGVPGLAMLKPLIKTEVDKVDGKPG
jgi:hypothetical protein